MDSRRLLTPVSALAAVAWLPSGCAALAGLDASSTDIAPPPAAVERKAGERSDAELVIVEPLGTAGVSTEIPYLAAVATQPERAVPPRSGQSGRAAIAIANQAARAPSRTDGFVGGVQVFSWSLGRVFEVWTAPLRVTTLTLGEGEVLVSKAAGDTVRWQIGETTSGAGAARRTHVLLKPLERGLETNLVLTTNRRVYLLDLRSGAAEAFNMAVAWEEDSVGEGQGAGDVEAPDPHLRPSGPLDARYRIEPQGRRARWTPLSVFNDGRRTFIVFGDALQIDEAPVLFVLAPDGEAQLVNYRQKDGLFVVDRLFDRAELRLGGRRPQVVRLHRLGGKGR